MKLTKVLLAALLGCTLVFASCGGKKSEEDEAISDKDNPLSALEKLEKSAEKMKDNMDESQKVMEERKKTGDTLAMNYKELEKYLPTSVSGYEKDGEPTGESVNMSAMSYSTCKQKFKKGDDHLEVTLTDYNQAYGTFQGLFAMAGMFSIDSDEEKTTKYTTNIERTIGIESYKKKSKDATVTLGAGYRFWIQADANNQADAEFLKKVVGDMSLKELANK